MKRKSTAKSKAVKATEITHPPSDTPKFIKNVYSSKVKVQVPGSGQTYVFEPGQALPVNAQDVDHLLSLKRNPGNCCGGDVEARHYFELVA